jgi:hypothetical protein
MPGVLSRRSFLMTGSAVIVPRLAVGAQQSGSGGPAEPVRAAGVPSATFPTQDADLVREMVTVAHGNVKRVKELVDRQPTLAGAAWDWGFGDWENALGAASHVGNREIAEYLVAHGARPTIFSAAMLGQLDVVKAFVAAAPGVQRIHGPHGITLLAHAKAGGERASAVTTYLDGLGDADPRLVSEPLSEEDIAALTGTYAFGPGPTERIAIAANTVQRGQLGFTRAKATTRGLAHRGRREFSPAGAPEVRITFTVEGGRAVALDVHDPDLVLTARRVSE